ncbi:MAG TPA: DMT family transporter [Bacteroidales bacterium]|nr:DMT family transporter [Bacteroidales bacterium]
MKNQSKAYLFALTTVLFWSTVATAFKISLRELNYIQLLFIANLTSLAIFFVILGLSGKLQLLKPAGTKELILSAIQGLLNPFGYYLILFKVYSILPAQVAQPANFIWPVVLMLLSVPLLKQPLKIAGVIALLISFSGVFVLATQGKLNTFRIAEPIGVALAVCTSVIWSLYWIINLKDGRDDLVKLFLSFLFSMMYVLILTAFTGNMPPLFSIAALPAVYVGFFEMGLSFVFWLKALQYSESTGRVANLIYITPFLSLLIIHVVLHEQLLYTSFIGLCLIVVGIVVSRIKK